MNIPKVGQKYLCVCNDRKKWVDFGQSVEVIKKQNGGVVSVKNTTTGKEFAWNFIDWPNDFKLVQESDDVHHDVHDAITYMYSCLSKPPVDEGKPPLGLQSRDVVDNLRVQDILAAMQRYVAANKAVPEAWLEELIDKIELEYTLELQGLS